jgi:hypothetical protein
VFSPSWEQLIKTLEEGSSHAYTYYQPMREAVVQITQSRGHRRQHIVQTMTARSRGGGRGRGNQLRDNLTAFEAYENEFLPQIGRFRSSFLREKQAGCQLEGLTLKGAPHFEVDDARGRRRHVFLHAANWDDDDLAAYLELLGVIVEQCYGGDSSSLWIMDLRNGTDIRWKSKSRMRKRCSATAKHYLRLVRALESEE